MYDFPPYRPPSESDSVLIRVTRGCAWNRCTFCGMYKGLKFELRSYEEIASDIAIANNVFHASAEAGFPLHYNKQTIFIGDSDSLIHKDILKILTLLNTTFPNAVRITSYTRAYTLAHKSIDNLKALRTAGLSRLHIGLESGDAKILSSLRKGATPEMMIKGGQKAKDAGFEICFYILCGAGGEDYWGASADGTAKVINSVVPDFIRLRTLSLVPNAPLYDEWKAGKFNPITPLNRLKETRKLVSQITVSDCSLSSDHITNYLWSSEGIIFRGVDGKLSQDKPLVLAEIDKAIEEVSKREIILDANTLVQQGTITHL